VKATQRRESDIHRDARKPVPQLRQHWPSTMHGQEQLLAGGGDGTAADERAHIGENARPEAGMMPTAARPDRQ